MSDSPTLDTDAIRALAPTSLYSLAGRVAVVTGATGGLGQWFAAGLGAAGAGVFVTDLEEDRVSGLVATLRLAGIEAAGLAVDLERDDAPMEIVASAVEHFGAVNVLVNNAAVNRRMPMLDMDRDTWDWITRIDLRLPYFLSQEMARRMVEQGSGGSIISISSLNALYALEQISVYGPAKAGLSQLTKVMALEWAEHGIRANAIAPGFMDTPLAAPVWDDDDMRRWIFNRVPVERPGLPRELVGTCVLLASDAGSFLTGQTLYVDGGASAGGRWFHPDR